MKKTSLLALVFVIFTTLLLGGVVQGDSVHVSGATVVQGIEVPSASIAAVDVIIAVKIDSHSEITSNISDDEVGDTGVATDLITMQLHSGTTDVPFMPGTKNQPILQYIDKAGVDKTAETVTLVVEDILPAASGEEVFMSIDHRSLIIDMNIGPAAVGTSLVWELYYFNPTTSAWVLFPDADVCVTTVGPCTTTLSSTTNLPLDWTRGLPTDFGSMPASGYWIKLKLASGTVTTPPKASTIEYRTGIMLFHLEEHQVSFSQDFLVYKGGATTMRTFNSYFPGFGGITLQDQTYLEMNYGATTSGPTGWGFKSSVGFNLDKNESGSLFSKVGSMTFNFTTAAAPGGNNAFTLSTPGSPNYYGEWSHNENDGGGYYSGAGLESHSKGFTNKASKYKTAREEDSSDSVTSDTGLIGISNLKGTDPGGTDTTPEFGAKINDPT